MTQAFFYKHVVPARDFTLVPEDRFRFREEAARTARRRNRPTAAAARAASSRHPMEILSQQPVKIPVGGTVEVQVRMSWSRNGQAQVDLSDPPEGITVDRVSWTEKGMAVVLRGDAAKAKPRLKGNLMANAFLQTTVTEKGRQDPRGAQPDRPAAGHAVRNRQTLIARWAHHPLPPQETRRRLILVTSGSSPKD